ncbi:MAG: XrtA-associated ATPase [Pseudomonadales bacterium]|uniref:General secretion pathway protein A n=1 Tax=Oleiphilus messinensis TaxID=141451 RepID=A0A1Y0I6N3_9GAMM|nr:XrtA/PEP-CTERM system-associated ATPase [Oleiphilus messinensis]ARU56157.1 general secretion pathway protein A [Oleiphilus messinensis]MCG8611724.1 XrtA-associated ATPase [Pseudomonadales bacterium]
MYESHFGFTAKPFQLTPDPQFFYASSCHKKALYYLQYGLHQGEGFIVITGPIGTGKSTLASNLLNSLDNKHIVASQVSVSNLSPRELLEHIANAFGVQTDGDSKAQVIKAIENYLFTISRNRQRALLIIDEAQNLSHESLEELRLLSNYQVNSKPLLQTFLLGQEELRDHLQHPSMLQFQQRVIASFHLRALTDAETKQYVMHRLLHVGWTDKPAFTEQALAKLHQFTQGIPRRINIFMDRTLLMAFLEGKELIDSKVIESIGKELEAEFQQETSRPARAAATGAGSGSIQGKELEGLIQDLNEILESALEQKIAYTKFIDTLISKRRALRELAKK